MKYLKETNFKMGLNHMLCIQKFLTWGFTALESLFFWPQKKNYKVTLMDQGKNFLQAS